MSVPRRRSLTEDEDHRFQRAARGLLRHPVMRARGPHAEEFRLVRNASGRLRDWFDRETGWRLTVDSEVARLFRIPATDEDHTHPARESRSGAAFARRRYVLVCLALAVLDRSDAQITLGRLAEGVLLAAGDEHLAAAGISFTMVGRDERADLVAAVRLLLDMEVLVRVAGSEDAFMRESGDVLYDIERRVLSGILVSQRGPSTISESGFEQRLRQLRGTPPPDNDDMRNLALRHALTRRLLDDPVIYYTDLSDDERAYLTSQRSALTSRVTALTGMVVEARAEGIAMVDADDDLTDCRMPETGTDGHVTLLIAEHLAGRAGNDTAVSLSALHKLVRRLATEHRGHWRKESRAPGAEVALVARAIDQLEALRLARRRDDGVVGLPALSRYAVAAPTVRGPLRSAVGTTQFRMIESA